MTTYPIITRTASGDRGTSGTPLPRLNLSLSQCPSAAPLPKCSSPHLDKVTPALVVECEGKRHSQIARGMSPRPPAESGGD